MDQNVWESFFVGMTSEQVSQAIAAIETLLQPTLYKDANWIADYRRIRIIAIRK